MLNDAKDKPIELGMVVFRVIEIKTGATGSWVRSRVVMGDMVVASLHSDQTISIVGDRSSRIPAAELYTDLRDAMVAYKKMFDKSGTKPRLDTQG